MKKTLIVISLILLLTFNNVFAEDLVLLYTLDIPNNYDNKFETNVDYFDFTNYLDADSVHLSVYGSGFLKLYNSSNVAIKTFTLTGVYSNSGGTPTWNPKDYVLDISPYDFKYIKFYCGTNSYTSPIFRAYNIQLFGIPKPLLTLTNKTINNDSATYVFNKQIKVDENDIKVYKDNSLISFDYTVNNNTLTVSPILQGVGNYIILVNKVYSLDMSESLNNISSSNFEIQGLSLQSKNFSKYVSTDFNNFIFTFTKNLSSANIYIKDSNGTFLNSTTTISGKNLILQLNDSLVQNSSYKVYIDTASSVDNNILISPLIFDLSTRVILDNPSMNTLVLTLLNVFDNARNNGIKIVVLAIIMGIIFIISKWLWNKLKTWLRKV